jgi:hypothetical protein
MLAPYLRKADTTSMLLPYFKDADTTSLNLTSRFAAKQNLLNGTGFVKASGTNITFDNSSYLTTSSAASTYLPLTGGTLSGNLRLSSSNATQLNIDANDNNLESRITFSTIGSARSKIYTTSSVSSMTFESIAQASARRGFRFISSTEGTQYLGLVQDPQGNVGIKSDAIGNDVHPNTLYVNGTLGVTGDITEAGNNVMTNLDTVSLSNRINGKVGLTGNETIAGDKTFSSRVNTPWLERTYISSSATSLTVSVNTTWLNIHQDATVTLTLPNAATYPGKELIIKQTGDGNVLSASSNIIGFTVAFNGSTQTAIIAPASYRFATLISDGTNWVIMQRNN